MSDSKKIFEVIPVEVFDELLVLRDNSDPPESLDDININLLNLAEDEYNDRFASVVSDLSWLLDRKNDYILRDELDNLLNEYESFINTWNEITEDEE